MKYRLKIGKIRIRLEDILFVFYFCRVIFTVFINRIIPFNIGSSLYVTLFFILLFLCIIEQKISNFFIPIIVYWVVAIAFLLTYFIHPEYISWFSHDVYGIIPAFLNPGSGIWALMIVWIMKDDDQHYKNLEVVCFLLFLFYVARFVSATRRGYWIVNDISGQVLHSSYDLEFGYDMLFPVAFIGSMAFLNKRRVLYIPCIIGIYVILMGGSRGALIWPIVMFPIMMFFRWKEYNLQKRIRFSFFCLLFLIVLALISFNYEVLRSYLLASLDSLGIDSRTVKSILSGTFSDGNGREMIYKTAIEMIKTGGPFGWGVYGDRYVIGNIVRWGYAHNVILEILVSFGYFLGTIIIAFLGRGMYLLFRECSTPKRQIIFITYLITSMKLMLSNSFWYTGAFWAILALVLKWRRNQHVC